MELAQALQLLWGRKIRLALGLVVAGAVGVIALGALKTENYATAATQMIVDSPKSPLGNTSASLTPFTTRASVYADLMASHPALVAIGQAAHIPANQIDATAPANPDGTTTVAPVPAGSAQSIAKYKLFLDQDPTLPTINVYAEAPTTAAAIALANGAVTGFKTYLSSLEDQNAINTNQRVEIRQLGGAVGGMVDPHASKKIAAVVVLLVFLVWCAGIMLIERKRATRGATESAAVVPGAVPDLDDDPLAPGGAVLAPGQVSNGGHHRVHRVEHSLSADLASARTPMDELDATFADLATHHAQSAGDAASLSDEADVPPFEPAWAPDER